MENLLDNTINIEELFNELQSNCPKSCQKFITLFLSSVHARSLEACNINLIKKFKIDVNANLNTLLISELCKGFLLGITLQNFEIEPILKECGFLEEAIKNKS